MEQIIDHNEAILRLTDAINKIDGAYYFCAKHMGIKENTLAVLFALDDGKPHSQTQIAREWLIPKTTVNTVVKELTAEGTEMMLDLMCAKGREHFYESHGFLARPTDSLGPGMIMYIQGEKTEL